MLRTFLILLVNLNLSIEVYVYGDPGNGKVVHNMRTFMKVTFALSAPQDYRDVSIPQCHEQRLRRSYYELSMPAVSVRLAGAEGGFTNIRTGHIIYPLSITVINGTKPRSAHFAAGVHTVYSGEDYKKIGYGSEIFTRPIPEEDRLVKLIIVSETTWKLIWRRWSNADKLKTPLCDGGIFVDQLLARINRDARLKPQYDDLGCDFGCMWKSRLRTPKKSEETLTFAYPTTEGLHQLASSPFFGGQNVSVVLESSCAISDNHLYNLVRTDYRGGDIKYKQKSKQTNDIKSNQCIFYPPFS